MEARITVRKSIIMCMRDNAGCNLSRWGGSGEKSSDCRNILRLEPIGFAVGCLWDVRD